MGNNLAKIGLDGREIELLLLAIQDRMNSNITDFERRQFDLIANKLLGSKKDFHQVHYNDFAQRYGLNQKVLV